MQLAHENMTSDDDERDWSEWGDADDEQATKSLFSDNVLPSAQEAISFDARQYNFNISHFKSQVLVLIYASATSPSRTWLRVRVLTKALLCRTNCPITTLFDASTT